MLGRKQILYELLANQSGATRYEYGLLHASQTSMRCICCTFKPYPVFHDAFIISSAADCPALGLSVCFNDCFDPAHGEGGWSKPM